MLLIFLSEITRSSFKCAKSAYEKILEKHKKEETPFYKNRKELDQIKSKKNQTPQNWWQKPTKNAKPHTAILFVPPTPNGGLAKALRRRECELNSNNDMSIRIIEKGGTKVKSILTTSDPFPKTKCDLKDCPFCSPTPLIEVEDGQNCRVHNVGYRILCKKCSMKYEGESHRMISVRASEHVRELRGGTKNNPLYKHKMKYHPKEGCNFKIKVTGKFFDALSRQADESVRIQSSYGLVMNSKSEFNAPPIKRIVLGDG